MFKSEFQGGSYVEVFSAQGRNPVSRWKLSGPVRKEFDRLVKGYVYTMEGGSSTTRMQLPKTDKGSLGLLQCCFVLQVLVPSDARFAIDLSILDRGGSRRRLQLSTSIREISASPLNARAPLTGLCMGQWLNLCLDLGSLVSGLFKGQTYKSLEGISIGGSCMLRRLFTLRSCPLATLGSREEVAATEGIPRACQMPGGSVAVETQVLTYNSLTVTEQPTPETTGHPSPPGSISRPTPGSTSRPTHVAFGSKVAIPDHILQTASRSGSSMITSRGKSGSTRKESADSSRSGSGRVSPQASLDGHSIRPRPPSHPADQSLLRIQRKRVRMISSGQRREASKNGSGKKVPPMGERLNEVETMSFHPATDTVQSQTTTEENSVTGSNSGYRTESSHTELKEPLHNRGPELTAGELAADEHMALNILHSSDVHPSLTALHSSDVHPSLTALHSSDVHPSLTALHSSDVHPSLTALHSSDVHPSLTALHSSDVYSSLTAMDDSLVSVHDHSSDGGSTEDMDSSADGAEVLYSYRSPPKSASRRQPDLSTFDDSLRRRGPTLDEDFVSGPHQDTSVAMDTTQMTQTRLSDDYDWRRYTSADVEDDFTQSDMSLRTRLANRPHSPHILLTVPTSTDTAKSNSSELESTLSGSMTLSGWTEKFKDAAKSPPFDSLDMRGMGGTMSPTGTLTDQPDLGALGAWQDEATDELELMYDPQLNCFYDPQTCKYYELVQ